MNFNPFYRDLLFLDFASPLILHSFAQYISDDDIFYLFAVEFSIKIFGFLINFFEVDHKAPLIHFLCFCLGEIFIVLDSDVA